MEKHRLIDGQIYYPVGHDLVRNIRIIKQMAEYIYLVLSEYYSHDRTILVCRGASGSIIAGIIAPILFEMGIEDIQIYHIKKEGESTHTRGLPNGFETANLVVVDDFICTGQTIEAIHIELDKIFGYHRIPEIVCVSGLVDSFPDTILDCDHLICS